MTLLATCRTVFTSLFARKGRTEENKTLFRHKYQSFRNLLRANNNALQAMAEFERIYYSGDSYRITDIKEKIAVIFVNVFKMIKSLVELSEGRYAHLEIRFLSISASIETILARRVEVSAGPWIIPLHEAGAYAEDLLGAKMARLAQLQGVQGRAIFSVPAGFVITASATRIFLTPAVITEVNRRLQILDPENLEDFSRACEDLQNMIRTTPVPTLLQDAILSAYRQLMLHVPDAGRVALRSSAHGEDSSGLSFAGLYSTVLDVDEADLLQAYREVIASKYSARAISYRRKRGFRHEDIEMCVGCLCMVHGSVSGVLYSRALQAPHSPDIVILATAGSAKGVVSGTAECSRYHVLRPPFLSSSLWHPEKNQHTQLLTSMQQEELAAVAIWLENYFGRAQDIEWTYDRRGCLCILQSRALIFPEEERQTASSCSDVLLASASHEVLPAPLCTGIPVSRGIASAPLLYFAETSHPLLYHDFPPETILAVDYPVPEWAPLLGRAAAVIARHGSEVGHLATVAREYALPAVFGLGNDMTLLIDCAGNPFSRRDGQITVDGDTGNIYSGCQKAVLGSVPPKRDLMAGSPIQRITTEIMQYITPLSLTDPTAPTFKIDHCESLHDVTRYCHEKSVMAMFHFSGGKDGKNGEAKRLLSQIPLEWWVINLDNGFVNTVRKEQPSVLITEISSLPMQAIWQGITAFPWQGPPPISARGFGSILMQSVMRPELDPAVASPLRTKNIFLISRNFCNLSVRLGYHYALIESYLGDFVSENYVTFRFKGGAADMRRKAIRARLLAEILDRYGFRVELRSDSLLARMKKQSVAVLQGRLRLLGYLTLHARQLDMVMDSKQQVEQYKSKFITDIDILLHHGEPER